MAAREAAKTTAPATSGVSYAAAAKRGGTAAKGKATPPQQKKKDEKKKGGKRKRRPRVPRAPKSAAISLTLQPGAAEKGAAYNDLLKEAEDHIDLSALGITGLIFRVAAGGGRLLEIEGADAHVKADALAQSMRGVLSPEVVRIVRPQRRCSIRIRGLADGAKAPVIEAAVAAIGSCAADLVKAGKVTAGGAVLVSLPVAAAKKVADAGRVRVGWISAAVEVVAPRPKRCFRCMRQGHFAVNCQSPMDLAGRCFRCGKADHVVRDCTASHRCADCEAAGLPAGHTIGDRGCPSRIHPARGLRHRRVQGSRHAAPRPPEEAMDTAVAATQPR